MRRFVLIGSFFAIVVVFGGLVALILFHPNGVLAHQSGCHRWHSCPSDPKSKKPYICGDTGYCSQCPNNKFCKNKKYIGPPIRRK